MSLGHVTGPSCDPLFSCSLLDAVPGLPARLVEELGAARPARRGRLPEIVGRLTAPLPVADAAVVALHREPSDP